MRIRPMFALSLMIVTVSMLTSAQARVDLNLKDALAAAIETHKKQLNHDNAVSINAVNSMSWLDGAPFVSVSALKSQSGQGTDELETALTLPIKSRLLRVIEGKISDNAENIATNAKRQQALFLSGKIRTIVWDAQALALKIDSAQTKFETLNDLNNQFTMLFESSAIPEYVLLLLEKEVISTSLNQLELEHQYASLLSEFSRLTGLTEFPMAHKEEDVSQQYSIQHHPNIAMLDSAWEYFANTFEATNKKAQPWHLKLTARQVEVPNFDETQIGIGVDIPLSLGGEYSKVQRLEYNKTRVEYELAKQQMLSDLGADLAQVQRDLVFLERKQILLDKSVEPIQKLEIIIPNLLSANVDNKELLIRNALDVLDARAAVELNRINIMKYTSLVKQALGHSI